MYFPYIQIKSWQKITSKLHLHFSAEKKKNVFIPINKGSKLQLLKKMDYIVILCMIISILYNIYIYKYITMYD